MPRFTIKDLLIATTLVAIGAGMIAFLFQNSENVLGEGSVAIAAVFLLWFGGGACIGAGLLAPFKKPWTGVIIAIVIQVLTYVYLHSRV